MPSQVRSAPHSRLTRLRSHLHRHGKPKLPASKSSQSSVYIYPGILRLSPAHAVLLDLAAPSRLHSIQHPSSHDRECPICLCPLVPNLDLTRTLTCDHTFHSLCLLTWLSRANRCPLCNRVVSHRLVDHEHGHNESKRSEKMPTFIPDNMPATLYPIRKERQTNASCCFYAVMQHDQTRFADRAQAPSSGL